MTYTTPLMVADWAKADRHSCYFLKQNTLVYRHVIDGHKRALAFTEHSSHAYFYTSAAPFQHMTPMLPRILDSVCLPKPEQTPLWEGIPEVVWRAEARTLLL